MMPKKHLIKVKRLMRMLPKQLTTLKKQMIIMIMRKKKLPKQLKKLKKLRIMKNKLSMSLQNPKSQPKLKQLKFLKKRQKRRTKKLKKKVKKLKNLKNQQNLKLRFLLQVQRLQSQLQTVLRKKRQRKNLKKQQLKKLLKLKKILKRNPVFKLTKKVYLSFNLHIEEEMDQLLNSEKLKCVLSIKSVNLIKIKIFFLLHINNYSNLNSIYFSN